MPSLTRFLLAFWQRIPKAWRTRLLPQGARAALAARLSRGKPNPLTYPAPSLRLPLLTAGLLTSTSGIGETARLAFRALRSAYPGAVAYDVSGALGHRDDQGTDGFTTAERPAADASLLLCLNAPSHTLALDLLGTDLVRGRRVIGYWVWDLPSLPESWRAALPFLHEIWTPSHFVAAAVRKMTAETAPTLPVRVVPYPAGEPAPSLPQDRARWKERLSLQDNAVLSFQAFSMDSNFTRKNPMATLAAHQKAFGDDPRHRLLFKVRKPEIFAGTFRQFAAACARRPNITLITENLTGSDMAALNDLADIIVSLHRAEGFGLVPAEAMARGKAVLATDYSGTHDFLCAATGMPVPYTLVPVQDPLGSYTLKDTVWAEADIDAAAAAWQRLGTDADLRARLGAAAKKAAPERFGKAAFLAAFAEDP